MWDLMKAEHLKQKHTFGGKIFFLAPCVMLMLAFSLTRGNFFSAGAWNWWYTAFLTGTLAIACYLSIQKDRKLNYQNLLLLYIPVPRSWDGKVMYLAAGLLISNGVLYLGSILGDMVFGSTLPSLGEGAAVFLLTATHLWEIPLFLFLSTRYGMFLNIFFAVLLTGCGVMIAPGSFWWAFPGAIPARLMCPVLGLLPNGLPVPVGSAMNRGNVILPGVVIAAIWFLAVDAAASNWFARWEGKA